MQGLLKKNEKKLVVRYFIFTFSKIKFLGDSESCDFKWLPTLLKSNYSVKHDHVNTFIFKRLVNSYILLHIIGI